MITCVARMSMSDFFFCGVKMSRRQLKMINQRKSDPAAITLGHAKPNDYQQKQKHPD